MANIAIMITGIRPGETNLIVQWEAHTDAGGGILAGTVEVAWNAAPTTITDAVRNAAIAAAGGRGETVGLADTKTIFSAVTVG